MTGPYLGRRLDDDLARMITELTSELWVLRDRVMVLERLLADHGVFAQGEVDEFVPDERHEQAAAREREALIARVLGAPHNRDVDVSSLVAQDQG